jgi:hypothetical protein
VLALAFGAYLARDILFPRRIVGTYVDGFLRTDGKMVFLTADEISVSSGRGEIDIYGYVYDPSSRKVLSRTKYVHDAVVMSGFVNDGKVLWLVGEDEVDTFDAQTGLHLENTSQVAARLGIEGGIAKAYVSDTSPGYPPYWPARDVIDITSQAGASLRYSLSEHAFTNKPAKTTALPWAFLLADGPLRERRQLLYVGNSTGQSATTAVPGGDLIHPVIVYQDATFAIVLYNDQVGNGRKLLAACFDASGMRWLKSPDDLGIKELLLFPDDSLHRPWTEVNDATDAGKVQSYLQARPYGSTLLFSFRQAGPTVVEAATGHTLWSFRRP